MDCFVAEFIIGPAERPDPLAPRNDDVPELDTIEGFWSIIKRGIVGTFHNVRRKYLHLYVAKLQFRYNNRFDFRNGD
jgi:hypothetical protein